MSAEKTLVSSSVVIVEDIMTGFLKGGGSLTRDKRLEIINAVATIKTPSLLGLIPLRSVGRLEQKIIEEIEEP